MSIGGKPGDRSSMFDYITDMIQHVTCQNYFRDAKPGMSEAEFTYALIKEFEDKIVELGGEDAVIAYFAEPILGGGGVVVPQRLL